MISRIEGRWTFNYGLFENIKDFVEMFKAAEAEIQIPRDSVLSFQ